jgi:hypothetical protein
MANQKHLDILKQGVEVWNQWRKEHPHPHGKMASFTRALLVDLSGADLNNANLSEADLSFADLSGANLSEANLSGANLWIASLNNANLSYAILNHAVLADADLSGANLSEADLSEANLSGANLSGADLSNANLNHADLSGAKLFHATLVETKFAEATLTNCHIYGIAAWKVELKGAKQHNLVITPEGESTITVDNLEVAQFIYLLLNNPKIREVIDTIARKAVLILGRFTPERKAVLDALRNELRTHGYVPILFDFDKPVSLDLTETVSTLAHLARFIIADLTEPSSIPKELEAIVPTLAVPIQPLLEGSTRPYAMFKDYWKYQWVLEVYRYNGREELLASLKEHVIEPAEQKAKELARLKAEE